MSLRERESESERESLRVDNSYRRYLSCACRLTLRESLSSTPNNLFSVRIQRPSSGHLIYIECRFTIVFLIWLAGNIIASICIKSDFLFFWYNFVISAGFVWTLGKMVENKETETETEVIIAPKL